MSAKPGGRRWKPLEENKADKPKPAKPAKSPKPSRPSKPSNARPGVEKRPISHQKKPGNFYISKNTMFKAQLETCTKQMLEGEPIALHAVGAAINRCINLALQLQENHHGAWGIRTNTSTVDLIDDIAPQNDDEDYRSNIRQSSAIHIQLYPLMAASPTETAPPKCA